MTHTKLEIEYIKVSNLTPYAKNCKIHTPKQIEHIASSISQFGFNDPIGVCGQENIVLEGNGRLEALQLLGIEDAPCVRLDHLNEDERKAYVIAHNHLNLETGFDEDALLLQLQELQESVSLADLGFEAEKYISRLNELEKKELKPFRMVHYLISADINLNDKIIRLLDEIRKIEGVEIDSTLN